MGEPVVVGFSVLFVVGAALLVLGAFRRSSKLVVAGSAILLAIAGAWVLGLLGAAAGLVPLIFLRNGRRRDTQ